MRNASLTTPAGTTFTVDGDVVLVRRTTGERAVWIVHKADLSPIPADENTTLEDAVSQSETLEAVGLITQGELGEVERAGVFQRIVD